MKTRIKFFFLLSIVVLVSCGTPTREMLTDLEKDRISEKLIALTNEWVVALKSQDVDKLSKILSDKLVYYESNGDVSGKEKMLRDLDIKPADSSGVFDMKVYVYNHEFAMIIGKGIWITKDSIGNRIEDISLWSNLYIKENDEWRCTFGMGCDKENN